eukprot:152532_1
MASEGTFKQQQDKPKPIAGQTETLASAEISKPTDLPPHHAMHQSNNSQVHDYIVEEVPQNLINLGNPIKGLKHKYSLNIIRFMPYLVFSFINLIFCYPNRLLRHLASEDVVRIILLVYFGLILVICLIFSIGSCIKRSPTNGWRQSSNRRLSIPEPTTLYEIRVTEYLPSIIMMALVWTCGINIALVIFFPSEHISEMCYNDPPPPACFAVESFAGCYFTFATFGIFLMLQSIDHECKGVIAVVRTNLGNKYDNVRDSTWSVLHFFLLNLMCILINNRCIPLVLHN